VEFAWSPGELYGWAAECPDLVARLKARLGGGAPAQRAALEAVTEKELAAIEDWSSGDELDPEAEAAKAAKRRGGKKGGKKGGKTTAGKNLTQAGRSRGGKAKAAKAAAAKAAGAVVAELEAEGRAMDAALAALQEHALPKLASLMDELASWAERLQAERLEAERLEGGGL
jgi:hypothetical protein